MASVIGLLNALPPLIWSCVAAAALWLLRPQLASALSRLERFEGYGVKVSLAALAEAVKIRAPALTGVNAAVIEARLRQQAARLDGAEILWVDDQPSGNRFEARIFQALGAHVTFAASSAEADRVIAAGGLHLILSDIDRGAGQEDGLTMLARLRARGVLVPVVFYVGTARQPPPAGAQGIADRPDALTAMVLDALAARA